MVDSGKPTDDALDDALKAEPKATDIPSNEEVPKETKVEQSDAEKELQQVKSELGRSQKAMQEMNGIKAEMESMKELLQTQATQKQEQEATENYVTTEADVLSVIAKREQKKIGEQQKYNDDYWNSVAKLAIEDKLTDEEMSEVENVLKTSFNHSDSNYQNSGYDAKVNYLQAKLSRSQGDKKKLNLKGDNPQGTSVGTSTENQTKDKSMPKLDKETQEYADKMVADGLMTVEQVADAFR